MPIKKEKDLKSEKIIKGTPHKKNNKLKEEWVNFVNIIGNPLIIFLIIAIISLIILSNSEKSDETFKVVLAVIISVLSSILGGIFAKKWSDIFDEKVLATRGKSAVRSLDLLILNISQVANRVKVYIERLDNSEEVNKDLTKNQFEEIIEKCNLVEEEAYNSIEDWVDIVPEATLKRKFGSIAESKIKINELRNTVERLEQELESSTEIGEAEVNTIKRELKITQEELNNAKKQLAIKEYSVFNPVILSDQYTVEFPKHTYNFETRVCSICNNVYIESSPVTSTDNRCYSCRGKMGLFPIDD